MNAANTTGNIKNIWSLFFFLIKCIRRDFHQYNRYSEVASNGNIIDKNVNTCLLS